MKECFNSTIVRLKEEKVIIPIDAESEFQFYDSTIKSRAHFEKKFNDGYVSILR